MSVEIMDSSIQYTKTTFPGGESCIRVSVNHPAAFDPDILIELNFESNGDLIDLSLLVDAIRRYYTDNMKVQPRLKLFLPYAPYARQDRVCNPGESLSIKVVADFINSLNFVAVCVLDPHSDVTAAVFNNLVVSPQEICASSYATSAVRCNTVVVAPDAGASKKARKFAQAGGYGGLVQAEKVRDLMSGRILETKVQSEHIGNKDFLIVDDICDGGRTFIELAKVLRPLTNGKIVLFVTHGIFSAGTKVFDGLIDEVYTVNTVGVKGNDAVLSGKVTRI